MRFLILGAALFFAIIGTNFAWRNDYGMNDLDLDWLYFGGDIIPGKMNMIKIDSQKLSKYLVKQ